MGVKNMKRIIGEAIDREWNLTNTRQLELCQNCNCETYTLMDKDGNRYCGKCRERRS